MFYFKKILTSFLLLTLVLSQLGYHFLYVYEQFKIKQDFKQSLFTSINENELISFNSNTKNLVWEEENEFSCNGEMYDVVKTKAINHQSFYLCVNDKKENELIEKYMEGFAKNHTEKKSKVKLNLPVFNAVNSFDILPQQHFLYSEKKKSFYIQSLISISSDIVIPPPKTSLV